MFIARGDQQPPKAPAGRHVYSIQDKQPPKAPAGRHVYSTLGVKNVHAAKIRSYTRIRSPSVSSGSTSLSHTACSFRSPLS